MTGTEIYKRTAAYEGEARTIRLHAPQWKFLLAFDGQRSLAEVALSTEISFAEALPLTEKYLGHGWIEEQPITLEQYLKRTGAPNISAIGAAIPPAVILHQPKPEPITSLPPPPPPTTFTSRIVNIPPLPTADPAKKSEQGPMRLSEVIDYIVSLAENVSLGQFLVYRVFLQVPPELLQGEDIASVRLVNDSTLIRGESLQNAIRKAVSDVTKHVLPGSVFAPA